MSTQTTSDQIKLAPHTDHTKTAAGQGTLYLTPQAKQQLLVLKEQEGNAKARLRITVLSGGCSGFQYKFDFDDTLSKEDLIFAQDAIEVVTDQVSFDLLKGVVIDYVQELIGSAFILRNPNASASCGCGNSFSL